jgi:Uncharacterized conserved protein (DUF2249)
MRLSQPGKAVDLHQGGCPDGPAHPGGATSVNKGFMPPVRNFKKFDVRPFLQKGREPLPEIHRRVEKLKADEGLIVLAPFLPSQLIEKLGSEGFESKVEPGQGGPWIVYF